MRSVESRSCFFVLVIAAPADDDAVTGSTKAVPPVPVRQLSASDTTASACIVSKKLNVQLSKGDNTYIHTYIHTYRDQCMYVCMYVCMYACMHALMLAMHANMHTYIHIYLPAGRPTRSSWCSH